MQHGAEKHLASSNTCNMADNKAIEQAISDLNAQEAPNIRATAKKYDLVPSTLMRRFKQKTVSRSEGQSRSNMLLTNAQELTLIEYLNKLSTRGLHPTPQMLENLVVEIIGRSIGERWIERFCKRHGDVIQSVYLRGIDQARHAADNSRHFQHYFDRVCVRNNVTYLYLTHIQSN